MYAIIATGGKQYKVEPGQLLRLEKLPAEVGQSVEIKPVLLVGGEGETKIGRPFLEGSVTATVVEQGKGRKVLVFKKKRRKGYKVKRGHRQLFTAVRIQAIQA